jgi:starvation-inducible DNA-binding protein
MDPNRNDGHDATLQIPIQPNIGLDGDVRQSLFDILNHALANEVVLAVKTRSANWNVSGAGFFELNNLFDSQHKQLNEISDLIAERVRILGGVTIGSLQEFILFSRLNEQPGKVADIMDLLADHEAAIRFLREDSRKCTEEYEDEGTFDLLVTVMRLHEKMAWVLRAIIEPLLVQRNTTKG